MKAATILLVLLTSFTQAQVSLFPYTESFDGVNAPALPNGWITSTNRSPSGDFVTTTSSPRSTPNAVLSTNATVSQALVSPTLNFSNRTPDKLQFYAAWSSTHTAGLLLEASADNGATFPIALSDTIKRSGTTGYAFVTLLLPPSLANQANVRIRWRIVGVAGAGTSATFRLDDVSITTVHSFDLALSDLSPISVEQVDDQRSNAIVGLRASVKNVGVQRANSYAVHFFRDANSNLVAEDTERFATVGGNQLAVSDSTSVNVALPPLGTGEHRFIAVVAFAQDTNPANDTASTVISIGAEKGSLVINEILYDPLPNQGEWIELYNRSSIPIDIARWRLTDRPTASGSVNTFTLTTNSRIIQSGDFVVAAADSAILSLFPSLKTPTSNLHLLVLNRSGGLSFGNDGDDIVLRDGTGNVIDGVSYSPGWHHPDVTDTKGRSLERINPKIDSNDRRNWSTSAASAGGTPGKPNSIFTSSVPSSASISISPNPFSPDGDGFEDFCIIKYNLPSSTMLIRISIFDIKGRPLRTLANSELSGAQGEIIWDGLDDAKQRVHIGPYVVLIEAVDGLGGTLATAKAVAVVAAKL